MTERFFQMDATQLRNFSDVGLDDQLAAQQDAADDVTLRSADVLAEATELSPQDFVRSKYLRHVGLQALPKLFDLAGNPIEADAFPKTGDGLTVDTCLAIGTRFRERMLGNPSSGSAMACYIRHVLYAIGTGEPSPLQRDLVMTLNTYALRRSPSMGRIVGFVESALACPEELRVVLTGLLRDQKVLMDSVASSARAAGLRNKTVLIVGYSEAIVSMLRAATDDGSRVTVVIGATDSTLGFDPIRTAYERALRRSAALEIRSPSEFAGAGNNQSESIIDIALVATEALAIGPDGSLCVFVAGDAETTERLLELARRKPLDVISSLAKIHPDTVALAPVAGQRPLLPLDGQRINRVISEIGDLPVDDFLAHHDVATLSGMKSAEAFFSALIIRDNVKRIDYLARFGEVVATLEVTQATVNHYDEPFGAELEELEEFLHLKGKVPEPFVDGRAECEKLHDDESWVSANEGRYVASLGSGKFLVRDTFWAAVRAAKKTWNVPGPYVSRISREASHDLV